MSTTFGVKITPQEEHYHPELEESGGEYYYPVAFQGNRGEIFFRNPLVHLLPDETEVTALDNDSDIKTIGDIKRMINDNNMLVERRSH